MSRARRLALVWRTVRHLRASQVRARLALTLRRRLDRLAPSLSLPAPYTAARWREVLPASPWHPEPGRAAAVAAELAAGHLTLVNVTRPFGTETDWSLGDVREARLWTITLHYHEWLVTLAHDDGPAAAERRACAWRLIGGWLDACDVRRPGAVALAWNSFAIATRLRWWGRLLGSSAGAAVPPALRAAMAVSAGTQARMLASRLERDLLANHYLRDAVGLAWAAALLDVPEAVAWRRTASAIARSEARTQVLPDGGHIERSASYHAHVLEDFLELAVLLPPEDPGAHAARDAAARMAAVLPWLHGDDGALVRFNDGGPSGAPPAAELRALLEAAGIPAAPRAVGAHHLAAYGLVRHADAPWGLAWDVGPVGPDWQPGHAHADTLSLEATFHGRALLVDPGTFAYDRDARRTHDRATIAHNTLTVDGTDSTECWDIFRVGRRARPVDVRITTTPDGLTGTASHDGYDHLPGRPRHRRDLAVDPTRLRIADTVTGGGTHSIDGGWLLHPDWRAEPTDTGWRLDGPAALRVTLSLPRTGRHGVAPAVWHPDYGVARATTRLWWRLEAGPLPVAVETIFEEER